MKNNSKKNSTSSNRGQDPEKQLRDRGISSSSFFKMLDISNLVFDIKLHILCFISSTMHY